MTDRREPLPGVLGLPAFLLRKLSLRGRRIALAAGALLLVGAAGGTALLAPRIQESKEEAAERERAEAAAAAVERRRRLVAEQRPRFGRSPSASVGDLEEAITADAGRRARTGEVQNAAERTACTRGPVSGGKLPLACTAVTSEIAASEASRGVVVGYPYRALLDLRSGRYAFCKTSGRPGEGALTGRVEVALPKVCGG